MPTVSDDAQLSFFVYNNDVIGRPNRAFLPTNGWVDTTAQFDTSGWSGSGFGAGVFVNGAEVVIAFEGTNPAPLTSDGIRDWITNIGLTTGFLGQQAYQAALLYERVKAQYQGYQISFTGHSLGGGLASVMTEFFNKPSTTFAIAPFAQSVNEDNLNRLHDFLAAQPEHYFDTELEAFRIAAQDSSRTFLEFKSLRSRDVTNYAVNGEILSRVRGAILFPYLGNAPVSGDLPEARQNLSHSVPSRHPEGQSSQYSRRFRRQRLFTSDLHQAAAGSPHRIP